jgi:hypothetical protein
MRWVAMDGNGTQHDNVQAAACSFADCISLTRSRNVWLCSLYLTQKGLQCVPPWCSAWSRRSVSLKAVGTLPQKCAASKSLQQVVILTSWHLRLHVLHPSFESGQAIWEVGNSKGGGIPTLLAGEGTPICNLHFLYFRCQKCNITFLTSDLKI